ncbi:hypothetical protein LTR17_022044 [Elasticomyces elasticus]|nr:hypothetical protein LTR17_022044 [Elasticomyces elasticus]
MSEIGEDNKAYEAAKAKVLDWIDAGQAIEADIMIFRGYELEGSRKMFVRAALKRLAPTTPRAAGGRRQRETQSAAPSADRQGTGADEDDDDNNAANTEDIDMQEVDAEPGNPEAVASGNDSDDISQVDDDADEQPQKVPKLKAGQWDLIRRLQASEQLDARPFLIAHTAQHSNNARPLFTINPNIHEDALDGDLYESKFILATCIGTLYELEVRQDADRVRMCFVCLSIFVMCMRIDKACKKQRMTPDTLAKFRFLVLEVRRVYKDPTDQAATKRLQNLIHAGEKICRIYRECKPGSVFLVAPYLTMDILTKRTPMGGTGEAIAHLKSLGIVKKAKPFNLLAKDLWTCLTEMYDKARDREDIQARIETADRADSVMDET